MGFGEIEGSPKTNFPCGLDSEPFDQDADSGVSSDLDYTCAVNVHGTEDKVVNGVTFTASSDTSGGLGDFAEFPDLA